MPALSRPGKDLFPDTAGQRSGRPSRAQRAALKTFPTVYALEFRSVRNLRMHIGYARVSTVDQDPGYQLRALEERGCERIFTDHCSSRSAVRPQLKAALEFLREGDTLTVWKFDRIAPPHVRDAGPRCGPGPPGVRAGLAHRGDRHDLSGRAGGLHCDGRVRPARGGPDFRAGLGRSTPRGRAAGGPWGRRAAFSDPALVRKAKALLADPSAEPARGRRDLGRLDDDPLRVVSGRGPRPLHGPLPGQGRSRPDSKEQAV